jgi:molecular chaperone DnaK
MSDNGFKELPIAASGPITHSPSAADPIIGIDLGTTNSLVAIVENGTPKIIPTLEGRNLLPSVVHFLKNGKIEVGMAAREKRATDPQNTIYSVKRLLGRGASDAKEIQEHLPYLLDQSSSSNIKVHARGQSYTPIEISALILKELKAAAEEHLGRTVEDAVVTVPAYFNDSQRQATRAAGRLAGLNVLRILNEPTAASLAYGLQKKRNGLIAVYDLGGGTFDISILRLKEGIFEVLATNGDTQLGGDDLDRIIANWIEEQISRAHRHADLSSGEFKATLITQAEKLKIALSDSEIASLSVMVPGTESLVEVTLTREVFERLAHPLLERTKVPVEGAITDAGLKLSDLTDVVLVGGPTRLSAVKNYVRKLFNREPNSSLHPDEVVAIGAAVQADILAGNNRDFLLLDVVPLSLGMETFGGAMTKLIPRNTRIPTMAKEQFTTYVDGQTKVAINVFQGERELVKDNRKLAEFVLNDVPPLPAGMARVEVTFLVDADGILNVAARETYSGTEASIEVKPTYGLTDAEVESMLEAGLANAEKDRLASALVEARNDARRILLATEKALSRVRTNLDTKESTAVDKLVDDLKHKIETEDLNGIKAAHNALNHGTQHLAEILMSQTVENDLKNRKVKDVIRKG